MTAYFREEYVPVGGVWETYTSKKMLKTWCSDMNSVGFWAAS